ncbi:hypothetical protein NZK35_23230 [Stieleria sp. ICT_E10.1]|nr:hypothetical protein [Stieleria sedimenti]MCS7469576.1 hypothetical protein [Stieleria sedimenti]
MRVMNIVGEQPDIERAVAVAPDEIDRAIGLDLHPLPTLTGNNLSASQGTRPFDGVWVVFDDAIAKAFE